MFKNLLGYPDKLGKPEHVDCENYAHSMYVDCHCQPDDSKAAMLSLVIMGSAFLAFKLGAFFWVKYAAYRKKKNAEKDSADGEEKKSLIDGL